MRQNEARLKEARQIATPGDWELEISNGTLHGSAQFYRIFALDPGPADPPLSALLTRVHAEDRERVTERLAAACHEDDPWRDEFRLKRDDGTVRFIHAEGQVERSDSGLRLVAFAQDVTATVEAQRQLAASEAKYRNLMESASDAILLTDSSGHLLEANARAVALFGYSEEELLGMHASALHAPEDRANVAHAFAEMASKGRTVIEHIMLTRDGHRLAVEASGSQVRIGDELFYVGLFRDISERKRREQELREREHKYRTLMESLPQAVALKDRNAIYLSCNLNFAALLGLAPEEVVGRSVEQLHPAHLAQQYRQGDREVLQRATTLVAEQEFAARDGTRVMQVVSAPYRNDAGELVGVLTVLWDVTAHKWAEEALHSSEFHLAEAEYIAHLGSWEYDIESGGIRWSDGLYRIFGLDPSRFHPTVEGVLELVPLLSRQHLKEILQRALADSGEIQLNQWITHTDGTTRVLHLRGSLVRDEEGRPRRLLGIAQDITERDLIERELRQYRDNLERLVEERTEELNAANRELEAFSYSVSHDLRGPLRAINGFSQALVEDCGERLDDLGRDYLERIARASRHMSELIDGLLVLSRVIRRELTIGEVNLSEIAEEIARRLQSGEEGRPVTFRIQPNLTARADGNMARLLMENLLGNAWKFTAGRDPAVIEFGRTQHQGRDYFCVRDNGVGFDMRFVDKLFQPFQRLHAADRFEGTGIGLATVRRIIQRHGGEVWAEGEVEQFAAIHFSLSAQSEGTRATAE